MAIPENLLPLIRSRQLRCSLKKVFKNDRKKGIALTH